MRLFSPRDRVKKDPAYGIRAARRSLSYIIRVILLVLCGLLVCVLGFFEAERLSNLYILVTEGLSLRCDAILNEDVEQDDLLQYFLLICLEEDEALSAGTYDAYTISDHDYALTVEKISVLPWASTASVVVRESVTVKGALTASSDTATQEAPAWEDTRYRVSFVNVGTRWYISSLETLEGAVTEEPLMTPDLSRTPLPMATATPTPIPDIEIITE